MPFRDTCRMSERLRMLSDYDTGAFSVTQLCSQYGVSRPTFYLWLERRADGGSSWFADRSHAPLAPQRTSPTIAAEVIAVRRRFEHFGPKKVLAWLQREQPNVAWPAASTIGDILAREGLVERSPRRRRPVRQGAIVSSAQAANDEWCADFKGHFLTGDGTRCDPLTLTDSFSRYGLQARITSTRLEAVRACFEAAFLECGMPLAIRSDNGTPFGSNGAGGLSRLSVWLLRIGVQPRFIPPASPQHNGRHERFHRTLKAHTLRPPADTARQQQDRFDRFRRHYNEERPHEALGQTPPQQHWVRSPREMPAKPPEPEYDGADAIRRVRSDGSIKWRGQLLFIGEAFVGELIAVKEIDDGINLLSFCGFDLGVIDRRSAFRRFAPLRHRLREAPEGQSHPQRL
jgi:transposase InsO family protein